MPDSPPIPHRCRRGPRCPERERLDDGTVLGGLIPATDGLCPSCERGVERDIQELPQDYLDLAMTLGQDPVTGELVSGTPELPIPLRASIEAVQAAIVHEVACWAESVAEVRRITWDTQNAARSRPGLLVQRGANLLSRSVTVLLALRDVVHIGAWIEDGDRDIAVAIDRDGITGALTLLDLHHQTRAVAGRTKLVHHLPAPCPHCWYTALERANGSDVIDCTNCRRRYTWDEYDRLCNALAASRDAA